MLAGILLLKLGSKLILNWVEGSLASLSGEPESNSTEQEIQQKEASTALFESVLKYLHVLRLLSGSNQFAWLARLLPHPIHTCMFSLEHAALVAYVPSAQA